MQIRELSKPVTAKALNESLAKTFGYKLNLEQFSDVQLEDARNKLRTKISQFEVSESYDGMSTSPQYQKTRAMLDCVNQEILEREMNEGAKPDFPDLDNDGNKKEAMSQALKDKKKASLKKKVQAEQIKEKAMEHSVPESWINSALNRIELDEADSEELAAELTTRYDLSENQANYIVYLSEGEEQKAEVILATKDMVERITGWIEDIAAMKAEQLLELLDSIRESLGSDVAQQYQDQVKPALEAIYTALETSRQGLTGALAMVSGGEAPATMGAPAPGAPSTPPMGAEAPPMGEPGAEAGAEMPPELPAPEAGREKRESIDYSRRLGILLASKKK